MQHHAPLVCTASARRLIYRCGYAHLCAITQPTGIDANTASAAVPHRHATTLCSYAAPGMLTISSTMTGAAHYVTRPPNLYAAPHSRIAAVHMPDTNSRRAAAPYQFAVPSWLPMLRRMLRSALLYDVADGSAECGGLRMQNRGSAPRSAAQTAPQHRPPRGVSDRGATSVQRRFPRSWAARSRPWDMPAERACCSHCCIRCCSRGESEEGVSTVRRAPGQPPATGWRMVEHRSNRARVGTTSPAPNWEGPPSESSWPPFTPRAARPGE